MIDDREQASITLDEPSPRVLTIEFWAPASKMFYRISLTPSANLEVMREIVKIYNLGLRALAEGED